MKGEGRKNKTKVRVGKIKKNPAVRFIIPEGYS